MTIITLQSLLPIQHKSPCKQREPFFQLDELVAVVKVEAKLRAHSERGLWFGSAFVVERLAHKQQTWIREILHNSQFFSVLVIYDL